METAKSKLELKMISKMEEIFFLFIYDSKINLFFSCKKILKLSIILFRKNLNALEYLL